MSMSSLDPWPEKEARETETVSMVKFVFRYYIVTPLFQQTYQTISCVPAHSHTLYSSNKPVPVSLSIFLSVMFLSCCYADTQNSTTLWSVFEQGGGGDLVTGITKLCAPNFKG